MFLYKPCDDSHGLSFRCKTYCYYGIYTEVLTNLHWKYDNVSTGIFENILLLLINKNKMKTDASKEHPSFFAILPASVRYDGKLSEFQKLLFVEITALADKEGYCRA